MTSKEKRREIYDFIKKEIGEIKPNILAILSKKIKEHSKIKNELLIEELNIHKKKRWEYKKQMEQHKKKKRTVRKPEKKKDEPFFNKDFLS